jgi:hypothetical protein
MKSKHYIITLVVVLLAGALVGGLSVRSCQNTPGGDTLSTRSDTLPGDSVLYPVSVKIPAPVYIDSSTDVLVALFGADTAEVIRDYFRTKYYQDTVLVAGNFRLVVRDSVNQNRIVWRGMEHQNLRSTAINHITLTAGESNNPGVWIGGDALANSQVVYVGPSVMFKGRKPQVYKIGVQFTPTEGYRTMISFGYYKQINIRK